MNNVFHTYDIEKNGVTYRVQYLVDDYAGLPWEESDGHGIVSEWTTRDKRPGELVLGSERHYNRFYDFSATMKKARAESWGSPGSELNKSLGLTHGQVAELAVRSDFKYLRSFVNDEWFYCGVFVFPLDSEGNALESRGQSVWGIESNDDEYLKEVAQSLTLEIVLPEYLAA